VATKKQSIADSFLLSRFTWPFVSLFIGAIIFVGLGLFSVSAQLWASHYYWPNNWGSTDVPRKIFEQSANYAGAFGLEDARQWIAQHTYWFFVEATGIDTILQRAARGLEFGGDAKLTRDSLIVKYADEMAVAVTAIQTYGQRLGILLQASFAICLAWSIGFADGLVSRAMRIERLATESGNLYHRAKYFQFTLIAGMTMYLLCWPSEVHFGPWIAVTSVAVGLLARLQWTYYKKYL
jgi:hypothetical protein